MCARQKLFTPEQEAFFIKHQRGKLRQEIADLMNETFGINITAGQVSDQRQRLKITGGKFFISHPKRKLFTPEQAAFFKKHQRGKLRQEIADLMNETFGLQITAKQVKEQRTDMGITSGKLDLSGGRLKRNGGMFAKGTMPYNHLPVGTDITKDDGYIWRKIAEPNKWKQLHLIVWEEANGPKKPGELIIFLNGNKTDTRLENLAKITTSENAYMNHFKLRYEKPELTTAGINIAKMLSVCKQKEKRSVDK